MTAALIILAVAVIALDFIVWTPLVLRWAGIRPAPVLRHTGRHVSTERIHAGGRYLGTQPLRCAPPLTRQPIERTDSGPAPWEKVTTGNPVLADEPLPTPEQQRAEYFGWHGVVPHQAAEEAERLAGVMQP